MGAHRRLGSRRRCKAASLQHPRRCCGGRLLEQKAPRAPLQRSLMALLLPPCLVVLILPAPCTAMPCRTLTSCQTPPPNHRYHGRQAQSCCPPAAGGRHLGGRVRRTGGERRAGRRTAQVCPSPARRRSCSQGHSRQAGASTTHMRSRRGNRSLRCGVCAQQHPGPRPSGVPLMWRVGVPVCPPAMPLRGDPHGPAAHTCTQSHLLHEVEGCASTGAMSNSAAAGARGSEGEEGGAAWAGGSQSLARSLQSTLSRKQATEWAAKAREGVAPRGAA